MKGLNKLLNLALGELSAILLLLFGAIEYINYYWYRLSYGKSGFNLRILFNTGLKKSSINRMIGRYY